MGTCSKTDLRQIRRTTKFTGIATLCLFAACGGDDSSGAPGVTPPQPTAAAGTVALPPAAAGTSAAAVGGSGPMTGAAAGSAAVAPVAGSPSTNVPTAPVAGAAAPMGHGTEHSGMAGSGATTPAMMACKLHATADPRDAMLTTEPDVIDVGAQSDLTVPKIVLDWMDENEFAEAHDGWHLVRKWDQTCRKSNATTCTAANRLINQGLSRAPIQQGAPGDGLAFMMMHRHMIIMLKTAFPKNAALFDGFKKVPRTSDDPENPKEGHQIRWTSNNIRGFDILENIEQNLSMFPTEDDLGTYIQNTYKWTPQSPMQPTNQPGSGLHGALHAQWAVTGSPANLIDQAIDVKNYMFWKLHGWIDDVWERYRKAKNMTDANPEYQKLMLEQCMEMWALQPRNRPDTGGTTSPGGNAGSGATAPETGVFHTMIRPAFDRTCGGCHSPIAPSAGMTLGGNGITSKEILEGLIDQKSSNGEYNLITPGAPMQSWVYLKASGGAATATCSSMCDREAMPPSGMGLTTAQLETLRQWIQDGALTQ